MKANLKPKLILYQSSVNIKPIPILLIIINLSKICLNTYSNNEITKHCLLKQLIIFSPLVRLCLDNIVHTFKKYKNTVYVLNRI